MIFKRVEKSIGTKSIAGCKRPAETGFTYAKSTLIAPTVKLNTIHTHSDESSFGSDLSSRENEAKNQLKKLPKENEKGKRYRKAAIKRSDSDEFKSSSCVSESRKRASNRRQPTFAANEITGISNEEEKMLMIALKNSMREKNSKPSIELNEIEEMKIFRPTEEEFMDPIQYIESLYQDCVDDYGCIKIIPPAGFKPPSPIDKDSPNKLPSRFQTLQNLTQGIPFDYREEGITLRDFMKNDPGSNEFKEYIDQQKYDELEKLYWERADNSESDPITVEYAADLPSSKFGCQTYEESEKWYLDHPWNFNKMHMRHNSLLQFCNDKKISGITMSWIYVGMLFSSFCWHYEDVMLYSMNYMHEGEGKIWYGIPEYHRDKFEKLAKEKLAGLYESDPNFLLNINVMINPAYLVENGVHVYRTIQKPGEIIVTFPGSYHQGVSIGFNIAEAVNMACPSWLEYGIKSMIIYMASKEKIPVFPYDWLLVENARHIFKMDLDLEHLKTLLKYYENFVTRELTERSLVASHFSDKNMYKNDCLKMLTDRDTVEEDAYECYYCINLCYASIIKCLSCNKNYCISHELMCNCSKERIRVINRYSNEELNKFLNNIKIKISQLEN